MRRNLVSPLARIDLHGPVGVDGKPLVRVYCDAEKPRVGINKLIDVSNHRVPEDTGIAQIGQVCHVFSTIKLGRVDLTYLIFFEDLKLTIDKN